MYTVRNKNYIDTKNEKYITNAMRFKISISTGNCKVYYLPSLDLGIFIRLLKDLRIL